MIADAGFEETARAATFAHLDELRRRFPEGLPHAALRVGFAFAGRDVKLLGLQGIFTPAGWSLPLSFKTVPENPYGDEPSDRGLAYRYRGTDPNHRDNVGLKRAMETGTPLIYFHALSPGTYWAEYPMYIIGADDTALTFHADTIPAAGIGTSLAAEAAPQRAYRLAAVWHRMHQTTFRRNVISAYRTRCAVCRLRNVDLLDAAHILSDLDPRSTPLVPHGLSLCKLHHAAFDRNIVGIRPDYVVEVRRDVLDQKDGPMLEHGLRGFQGQGLILPPRAADHPKREFLEERYEEFRAAG